LEAASDSRDRGAEPVPLSLRVSAIRFMARDTLSFELDGRNGESLPGAGPGVHIALTLPNGLRRQYYCCGPVPPMLAAFEEATRSWPSRQVHLESFAPRQAAASEGGFTVSLSRTGREFGIPAGRGSLSMLREAAGTAVTSCCEERVCAACETGVIAGVSDRRDSILSPAERASSRMMICVSGSKSPRPVLDL
jgi:hypothetical protein